VLFYDAIHIKIRIFVFSMAAAGLVFTLPSCQNVKPYTTGQIKIVDPDTLVIEQPPKNESYLYWDRIDNSVFQQVRKPLDLNNSVKMTGRVLGLSGKKQADNVNHLDEVPESSWYNYRHYYNPMSLNQIERGPNTVCPDTAGFWSIFSAKREGASPGFFIKDAAGNRYLIKFDGINYPELTTSAAVIGTKIFYAAGYNVPESTIIHFDPDKVRINEGVMVEEAGIERPMTVYDYRKIVEGRPMDEHGKIRALASKFVDGVPVGQWEFKGTRKDDPNDRVNHEHRREIRGMRVISSWLNDTDRRDANTMAVFTANGYIKHFIQDFGNTLGANGGGTHEPIYGQAYLVDPRYMVLHALSLGVFVNNWETVDPEKFIPYPSVGYFRAETFKPGCWVPVHPLPAYENMTLRDAFWGAKLVMSFTDEEIRAIVRTGKLSAPGAEEYLVDVLIKRRDMIGRYWFSRINPLDKFKVESDSNTLYLSFTDLGVNGKLFNAADTIYEYTVWEVGGKRIVNRQATDDALITVSYPHPISTDVYPLILRFQIVTKRSGISVSEKRTDVYVVLENEGPRITGVRREE
jgi:hypothetical protein